MAGKLWISLAASLSLALSASAATEQPFYGAWGFDLAGRDLTVQPGDDFFHYANGRYQADTVIPADRPSYSPRLRSAEEVQARVHDLLEEAARTAPMAPTTDEGKIGALYAAFMDEARIDALGARPLAPDLEAIRDAGSRPAIGALMGTANASFNGSSTAAIGSWLMSSEYIAPSYRSAAWRATNYGDHRGSGCGRCLPSPRWILRWENGIHLVACYAAQARFDLFGSDRDDDAYSGCAAVCVRAFRTRTCAHAQGRRGPASG